MVQEKRNEERKRNFAIHLASGISINLLSCLIVLTLIPDILLLLKPLLLGSLTYF